MSRVFVCTDCKRTINSIGWDDDPNRNICGVCNWIRTNPHLTEVEKKELFKRLSGYGGEHER